jgi:BirA family biotin operon repressor/biotin-[acetyl-CoA-carboxylase] ligase
LSRRKKSGDRSEADLYRTKMTRSTLAHVVAPLYLHSYPRLRSTSDQARRLADGGMLNAPAVVFTRNQTAGRGRGTNRWWSGRGCLTVTFAFPEASGIPPEHVSLHAGVAVRRAVVELTGNHDVLLKWPNDLVFEGRKLAGLLCERHRGFDLIGLGLNVAPQHVPRHLAGSIASLRDLKDRVFTLAPVLGAVTKHLITIFSPESTRFGEILRMYDQNHYLVGREVVVTDGGKAVVGLCEGLDRQGRLLVREGRNLRRVIAGSVRVAEQK